MSSILDQKQRVATVEHCKLPWSGNPKNFRCYLCGHNFKVGDLWRFVYCPKGGSNFLVCSNCDGDDVVARWVKQNEEAKTKFWWLRKED
jgi:hypothetical protein